MTYDFQRFTEVAYYMDLRVCFFVDFCIVISYNNTVMRNLLEKLGFLPCGTAYVEEDDFPRLAFEKTSP